MMSSSSFDLVLKPACEGCSSKSDLYGSSCKHKTLCASCGKKMAESRARCNVCGLTITKLIREYNVRASASQDKTYSIARFVTGLPPFSKKKSAENKWTLHKEGLLGRQLTDGLKDKYKNKPWVLEDETGLHQYQGQQLEGAQSATYYLLVMHGKEFVAIPASSWYNFNKVAQYKQLTLEEAEEKMNKRKSNATGYERWMMKAATNGAAAFGEMKKMEVMGNGLADGNRSKKVKGEDTGEHSDKGEEDGEEEEARKNRLGLNKKVAADDEDGAKGDIDFDDDDIEKGDDWEHEEIFTDDDEAVGNDREERQDLAPEIPPPPEIKQDDDDDEDDQGEEAEGGLSKSGKELKKLLGKAAGVNESDAEDDEDDEDMDDETAMSPVLAPKQKDGPKDDLADSSPAKVATTGSAKGAQSTSKSKSKKKSGSDDAKTASNAHQKKESKPLSVKDEPSSTSKSGTSSKSSASKTGSTPSTGLVTEEEIRSILVATAPVTTQELVANFKGRIKSQEDKKAFADILRRISKIQKTNGHNYVVLREK